MARLSRRTFIKSASLAAAGSAAALRPFGALNALAQGQPLTTLPANEFVNLSITAGQPAFTVNTFDGSLFVQDDA